MENPEELYRELEKMRLQFRDLGYNLLKLIEEYQRAGLPLGETGRASVSGSSTGNGRR